MYIQNIISAVIATMAKNHQIDVTVIEDKIPSTPAPYMNIKFNGDGGEITASISNDSHRVKEAWAQMVYVRIAMEREDLSTVKSYGAIYVDQEGSLIEECMDEIYISPDVSS